MSDVYPTAKPAATPYAEQPTVEPLVLSDSEQETVDNLYLELKPEATAEARKYVLSRTPAIYQEAMTAKIDADWPTPPVE